METKSCCVTGHRNIPQYEINSVIEKLRNEVDAAIADGFTHFISGFAEGVDQYFARIVLERKKCNPALELVAVIPYRKRLETLQEHPSTFEMLESCADVIVMREEYHPSVYSHRNRYMVERSDRVIAVYDGREKGGTVRTIRFAHQMQKELRFLDLGSADRTFPHFYFNIVVISLFKESCRKKIFLFFVSCVIVFEVYGME